MENGQLPEVDQDLITIQIDDKSFSAMRSLLACQSFYFADLFNPLKNLQPKDKIYRIYGRQDMFTYILQFCHSHILPLLWTIEKGFDVVSYTILLGESIRFGVKRLSDWIKEEKYKETIQTTIKFEHYKFSEPGKPLGPIVNGVGMMNNGAEENATNGIQILSTISSNNDFIAGVYPYQIHESVYQCPRGVLVHRGYPERCGRECERVMPEAGAKYSNRTYLGLVVQKQTVKVKHDLLMPVLMPLSEEDWSESVNAMQS